MKFTAETQRESAEGTQRKAISNSASKISNLCAPSALSVVNPILSALQLKLSRQPSIFPFALFQFGGRKFGELNFSVERVERNLRLPVSMTTDDTPVNLAFQMLLD
jgi:hypothetical protein